jgi:hypothetical protein
VFGFSVKENKRHIEEQGKKEELPILPISNSKDHGEIPASW